MWRLACIGWLIAVISLSVGCAIPWQIVNVVQANTETSITFNPIQTLGMDIFFTCTFNRALYPMSVTMLFIAGLDYIIARRYRIIRNPALHLIAAGLLLWCELNWIICSRSIPEELSTQYQVRSWEITPAGCYFQVIIILVNVVSIALKLYQYRLELISPVGYTSLHESKTQPTV